MQRNLVAAICVFGLSLPTISAKAQDRFHNRLNDTPLTEAQPQNIVVADMAPEAMPPMAVAPTDMVNANVRQIISHHKYIKANANSSAQPKSAANVVNFVPQAAAMNQAKLKNYAPFMRNLMMASDSLSGAQQHKIAATTVMRGGKQVIVLGGK